MEGTADHEFRSRQASPALKQAMIELCEKTERALADVEGIPMGEAYVLAVAAYGANLPDFWRVWNSWNQLPDDPAPMGEL